MILRYNIFVMAFLFIGTVQARVWITHGFGAEDADWYQDRESGDFYQALKQTAANQGHRVSSFSWAQSPVYMGSTDKEHRIGGFMLATAIANFCDTYEYDPEYPNDHIQIVVAHSFGGKVAYYCSHTLELALLNAEKATTKNQPKESWTAWFRNRFKVAFGNKPQKAQPIIDKLFTLGTPHRLPEEPASKISVKKVYNIYSQADCVAHDLFAGSPLLTHAMQKKHPYAFNVCLLANTNGIVHGLGHSEIHSSEVARALFDIANHVDTQATSIRDKNHNHTTYCVLMPDKELLQPDAFQNSLDLLRAKVISSGFNPRSMMSK